MIIAMAGHVDHGKTSLIRALTGIDPDRLPDEKRRGMTIDLGFAHVSLPGAGSVGFVDVPGHERFLSNMLAGVLSVDHVWLVVAADDGPMPQTDEHLAVLRLAGFPGLTAVLTKIDRVPPERTREVTAMLARYLGRAGYPDTPVHAVSSHTGDGIDALRARLRDAAAAWRPRPDGGGFRLAIDRGFVVAGTGLVVTGTVAAGRVAIGDRLLVTPSRLGARVRGIQVHHADATSAQAGDRCALAIAGPHLERARLRRGDWLVAESLHEPTARIDVRLRTVDDRALRHAARVHTHIGSGSVGAKALVSDAVDLPPAQEGFVSLTLDRPIATLFGDRVILRDDTSGRVVGGGLVVDPFAPTRRTRREQRAVSLAAMLRPEPRAAVTELLAAEGWVDLHRFALARNLDPAGIDGIEARRIGRTARPILVSPEAEARVGDLLTDRLAAWHERQPDMVGPGKATLLADIPGVPTEIAEAVLLGLLEAGRIRRRDAALHLPGHAPRLTPADEADWRRIAAILGDAGLRPPRVRELADHLMREPDETESLLIRLERFGLLMRVARNRFFLPETVAELGALAEELARDSEAGSFTAASFNQRSGIGRNLTIPVLEYLDRIGVTRRTGELRHILRPVAEVLG